MSEPNYKEEYEKMIKNNLNNFNINNKDIKLKVDNFCLKFGFDKNEVLKQIVENKFLKAWFIKDPSKQNVYEKTFSNFLKNIKGIKNFQKLPPSGKDSIFIINQEVRKKEILINQLHHNLNQWIFLLNLIILTLLFMFFTNIQMNQEEHKIIKEMM